MFLNERDCSCPPVVGMQKGTGDLAQYTIRQIMPMMNTRTAAYGKTTPKIGASPAPVSIQAMAAMSRTRTNDENIPYLA